MSEFLLSTNQWDLLVDSHKNIALTSGAYAVAQSVACQIKLLCREGWFDQTQGVPIFRTLFQTGSSIDTIRNILESCALDVDGVDDCVIECFVDRDRALRGVITIRNMGVVARVG